jgi:hypothetical protein
MAWRKREKRIEAYELDESGNVKYLVICGESKKLPSHIVKKLPDQAIGGMK